MVKSRLLLCLLVSSAAIIVVCGKPCEPVDDTTETPVEPTTITPNCSEAEPGISWQPNGSDPCYECWCDQSGDRNCGYTDCGPPQCGDGYQEEWNCCPVCPHGPNCMHYSTLIKLGENVTMDCGEICTCQYKDNSKELEVVCTEPVTLTTTTTQPPGMCEWEGKFYEAGTKFKDPGNPCIDCTCPSDGSGRAECLYIECRYIGAPCNDSISEPDQCCPTCPNGKNCKIGDQWVHEGENVTLENGLECWCQDRGYWPFEYRATCTPHCVYEGKIYYEGNFKPSYCGPYCTCTINRTPDGDYYDEVECAEPGECEQLDCSHTYTPAGQCCPTCITECTYNGTTYQNREWFYKDPCTHCLCYDGDPDCEDISDYCPTLRCYDLVTEPDQCCATCPNGENCKMGDRVITYGELVILEYGEVCACDEEGEVECDPPTACPYNGTIIKSGESFMPDPCTWCECEEAELECQDLECDPPRCVDAVPDPTKCCPVCPNGPNCQVGDTVISKGETVTLDSGETCTCQGNDWDPPKTVCTLPSSPPPSS